MVGKPNNGVLDSPRGEPPPLDAGTLPASRIVNSAQVAGPGASGHLGAVEAASPPLAHPPRDEGVASTWAKTACLDSKMRRPGREKVHRGDEIGGHERERGGKIHLTTLDDAFTISA